MLTAALPLSAFHVKRTASVNAAVPYYCYYCHIIVVIIHWVAASERPTPMNEITVYRTVLKTMVVCGMCWREPTAATTDSGNAAKCRQSNENNYRFCLLTSGNAAKCVSHGIAATRNTSTRDAAPGPDQQSLCCSGKLSRTDSGNAAKCVSC